MDGQEFEVSDKFQSIKEKSREFFTKSDESICINFAILTDKFDCGASTTSSVGVPNNFVTVTSLILCTFKKADNNCRIKT